MSNEKEKLQVLDLFSGIGGFSLGLKRTGGFRTVAYCEIDPYCQAALLARMRDGWLDTAPIHTDITKLDGKPWRGRIDLICGGFPCQDISKASRFATDINGKRSRLWSELYRIVKEVLPRFVIAENSPVIRRRGLDRIVRDLTEVGYRVEWDVLPASFVGAKHPRERKWIVAYPEESGAWMEGRQASLKRRILAEAGRASIRPGDRDSSDLGTGTGSKSRSWSGRWWETEPNVGRLVDGIPLRMERLRSLGNAVVPQVVEWIGNRILKARL